MELLRCLQTLLDHGWMILNGRVLKTQMYPFKNAKGVSKYSNNVPSYSFAVSLIHKSYNQQHQLAFVHVYFARIYKLTKTKNFGFCYPLDIVFKYMIFKNENTKIPFKSFYIFQRTFLARLEEFFFRFMELNMS